MEWRDISSAPKDETEVLLWDPRDGVYCARYARFRDEWGSDFGDQWVLHDGHQDHICQHRATHWQPLPSPPTDKEPQ